MNAKRTGSDVKPIDVKRPRKECSYGESCFRKNPYHFKEFKHSHLEQILVEYSGSGEYDIPPSLSFQSKLVSEQLDILRENNITPADKNTASLNKPLESKLVNRVAEPKYDLNVIKNVTQSNDRSSSLDLEKKNPKNQTKMAENGASLRSSGDAGSQAAGPSSGRRIEDYFNVVLPRGKMAEKHRKAAPFYIFYTTITASPQTHNQPLSITFQELLDKSLGELHSSLQINFMVDIGWLLAHYYFAGYSNKPLTILYGEDTPDIKMVSSKKNNVEAHCVQMGSPFGKHHTKMAVFCYEDHSVRIMVSTANLYIDDWENRTQGLWLSPRCPPQPDGSMPHDGESATGFKASIISYLSSYRLSSVSPFIERIKNADFSAINVFFVASVPGGHTNPNWGMTRMGALLTKYCRISDADRSKWDLIVQASSIGSFGKEPKLWLTGDFLKQFSRCANQGVMQSGLPVLKLIYPSLENVQSSHDGLLGGGCLPYGASAHTKQTWLLDFLHQWKAVSWHRDRAMPHIKSYLRLSPCRKKAAFYHLTSANVSKAAWGTINKGNAALRIMSYEAGVLFLPEFVVKKDHFTLDTSDALCLPVPYDLPPIPYSSGMSPWVMDYLHS